ncbi:sperm acrosome membrane-associated protein 4-like [Carcharodon carcharias]|uniref:sperm acrosome membrane-associated protein 4-like n=1 Tax=Carcharodon carcharias TaxID=13397 RepID=UPI001B7DFD2E|nr:sperm acrosome membrane-associated protein 4-like [Carcharodon carcharias]
MKLLFLATFLAYFIVPATGLKCFQCGLSTSICLSKATCDADEQCFSRNSTTLGITVFSSGCISTSKCGKEVTNTLAGVSYKMSTSCCNYDYCNGAAAVKLSLVVASIVALPWFTSFL